MCLLSEKETSSLLLSSSLLLVVVLLSLLSLLLVVVVVVVVVVVARNMFNSIVMIIHIYIYTHNIHICICMCVSLSLSIYIYIFIHMCIYIYIYIYVYITCKGAVARVPRGGWRGPLRRVRLGRLRRGSGQNFARQNSQKRDSIGKCHWKSIRNLPSKDVLGKLQSFGNYHWLGNGKCTTLTAPQRR